MAMENTDTHTQLFTLKIAFGAMAGCELLLDGMQCVIDAAPNIQYSHQKETDGSTRIRLPCDEGKWQLHIAFPDINHQGYVELTDEQQHSERCALQYQTLLLADTLGIMLKPLHEDWSFNALAATQYSADQLHSPAVADNSDNKKNWRRLAGCLALCLIIGAGTLSYYANSQQQEKEMQTLGDLLTGSDTEMTIFYNQGGNVVLVPNRRNAGWVTQRLVSQKYVQPVKVMTLAQMEDYVATQLTAQGFPVIKVDLRDPQSPSIRLLTRTATEIQKKKMRQKVTEILPYVKHVNLSNHTLDDLVKKATDGVNSSGVLWTLERKEKLAIIKIQGELTDRQLQMVERFYEVYRQQWGSRYVHFIISLRTDYLKGKSLKAGNNGYVLLNNNHWLFTN